MKIDYYMGQISSIDAAWESDVANIGREGADRFAAISVNELAAEIDNGNDIVWYARDIMLDWFDFRGKTWVIAS